MEIIQSILKEGLFRLEQVNFGLVCAIIITLFLVYVILEYFWVLPGKKETSDPETEPKDPTKKTENGSTRKDATIFYYNKKTNKKAIALYFTTKPDEPAQPGHPQPRKKLLIFCLKDKKKTSFFFFKDPTFLAHHNVVLFNSKLKKEKEKEKKGQEANFIWLSQSMKIVHCDEHKTKVEGFYPHLIKTNEALLLLAEMKEGEALEEAWGEFYLFERTLNRQGKFVIHLWTGDRLEKAISLPLGVEKEISKIQTNYLDQETKTADLPVSTIK